MGHQTAPVAAYDEDYYAWTQRQAKLLRALNGLPTDLPKELDINHLAEEIEDLGRSELRSVTSLIRQVLVHLMKATSETGARARAHWLAEAATFQADVPGYYTPSMRQLIDLDAIWKKARKLADVQLREHGSSLAAGVPESCVFSLDDMVADAFDVEAMAARLSGAESSA